MIIECKNIVNELYIHNKCPIWFAYICDDENVLIDIGRREEMGISLCGGWRYFLNRSNRFYENAASGWTIILKLPVYGPSKMH